MMKKERRVMHREREEGKRRRKRRGRKKILDKIRDTSPAAAPVSFNSSFLLLFL